MKRNFLLFLLLITFVFSQLGLSSPSAAEAVAYSMRAAEEFCYRWNLYFDDSNYDIYGAYLLNDDNKSIKR